MTDPAPPENADHAGRMARKKAAVDAAIAAAQEERGVFLVLTGPGKGKSTSAWGMVARALAHRLKVGVVQFIKSRADTGEVMFFREQQGVEWHVAGEGYTWETQDHDRDSQGARRGWTLACGLLADPAVHLVVFDEMTYLFTGGHLDTAEVLAAIAARPAHQHVVITGRGAPAALIEAADTVSSITDVKHAFRAGVKVQKGVDL
jgi:cob(I)alamin adenosyltransferase